MGWATGHIEKLKQGNTVICRPRGNSMNPKIKSGQKCTIDPIEDYKDVRKGAIVLCKINGKEYLHLVKAVRTNTFSTSYLIGNNQGKDNGWVRRGAIFGLLTKVES